MATQKEEAGHGDYGLEIGRKGMDTLNSYIDLALEKKKPFFYVVRSIFTT